ncbi:MAG: hypothetical protein NTZ80_01920 [Patescibacteria group bacterium]|nr:hypothetical protein [Patescibacteria group bacterium]
MSQNKEVSNAKTNLIAKGSSYKDVQKILANMESVGVFGSSGTDLSGSLSNNENQAIVNFVANSDAAKLKKIINSYLNNGTQEKDLLQIPNIKKTSTKQSTPTDEKNLKASALDAISQSFITKAKAADDPSTNEISNNSCTSQLDQDTYPKSLPNLGAEDQNSQAVSSLQGLVVIRPQEGVVEQITTFTNFSEPLPIIMFDFDNDGSVLSACTSGNTCDQDLVYANNGMLYYKEYHKLGWTRQQVNNLGTLSRELASKCDNDIDQTLIKPETGTGITLLCEPDIDSTYDPVSRVRIRADKTVSSTYRDENWLKYFSDKPAVVQDDIFAETNLPIDSADSLVGVPIDEVSANLTFIRARDEKETMGYIVELKSKLNENIPTEYRLLLRSPAEFATSGRLTSISSGAVITDADATALKIGTQVLPNDILTLAGSGASADFDLGNGRTWRLPNQDQFTVPQVLPANAYPIFGLPLTSKQEEESQVESIVKLHNNDLVYGNGTLTYIDEETGNAKDSIILNGTGGQILIDQDVTASLTGNLRTNKYFDPVWAQDTDSDGIFDFWEKHYFSNLSQSNTHDQDQDGLDNLQEFQARTDPTQYGNISEDFDGDDLPDWYEKEDKALSSEWELDALLDYDHDGLTNLEEYRNMTNLRKPDSDDDGMSDALELQIRRDPLTPDIIGRKDGALVPENTSFALELGDRQTISTPAGNIVLTGNNESKPTNFSMQLFSSDQMQIQVPISLQDRHIWYGRIAPVGKEFSNMTWSKAISISGTDIVPKDQESLKAVLAAPDEIAFGESAVLDARRTTGAKKLSWKTVDKEIEASDIDPLTDSDHDSILDNDHDNPFLSFLADEVGEFRITLQASGFDNQADTIEHTITVLPPKIEASWNDYGGSFIQVVGRTQPNVPVWLCDVTAACTSKTAWATGNSDANGEFIFKLQNSSAGQTDFMAPLVNQDTGLLSLPKDAKVLLTKDKNNYAVITIQDSNKNILTKFTRKGDTLAGVKLIPTGKEIPSWSGSGQVFVSPDNSAMIKMSGNNAEIYVADEKVGTVFPGGRFELADGYSFGYEQDDISASSNRFTFVIQNPSEQVIARIFIDVSKDNGLIFAQGFGETNASDQDTSRDIQAVVVDKNDKIVAESNLMSLSWE